MARVWIGTSGWSYEHWRGIFYPSDLAKGEWLEYYCQHFRTVEINASFYHLPKRKTFENWRKRRGPPAGGFVFSVKGSRFISHIKRLKDCQEAVERFFEAANGLGGGVILWQLPPRLKLDVKRLEKFLGWLPEGWRYAFEFRDQSWLAEEVFQLLARHKAAVVFQDFPYWPISNRVTADFIYLRLHGKKELYASCYSQKELKAWAEKIKKWLKNGRDVYAYFNNDMRGYAVKNAQELMAFLR